MNTPINMLINLPVSPDLQSAAVGVFGMGGEEGMVAALAREAAKVHGAQTEFVAAAAKGGEDPAQLVNVQKKIAQFDIEMGIKSAVARKVVGAIETLIKS